MRVAASCVLSLVLVGVAVAQPPGGPPMPGRVEVREGERIAWFGTLKEGLAEAKRLGRPVMLVSAAPHCHEVPGVW